MKRALSFILAALILFAFAVPSIAAEDYPTNTEISFDFIDPDQFENICINGTFRCGDDLEPGDYYIVALYSAQSCLQVTDTPNKDFGSDQASRRILNKVHLEEGQFVHAEYAMVIPVDAIDTSDLTQYGIFEVGKDLPAGVYKIKTISNEYSSSAASIYGCSGAYQICDDSFENEPSEADDLWDEQAYITLEDGQFIIINDLHLSLSGATTHQASAPGPTPASTAEITPEPTNTPTIAANVENGVFTFTPSEFNEMLSENVSAGCKTAVAISDSYVVGILNASDNTVYCRILFNKDEEDVLLGEEDTEGINKLFITIDGRVTDVLRMIIKTVDPSLSLIDVAAMANNLYNNAISAAAKATTEDGSSDIASAQEEINGVQYVLVYPNSSSAPSCIMAVKAVSERETIYTDSATIAKVQEALYNNGYACGSTDGIMGDNTTNAIRQYQEDNGLEANGEITDELLKSLGIGSITENVESAANASSQPTEGETNAIRIAKTYLDISAYSYARLIEQLEYGGFSHSEAVYGVDNCGADWFEQAAKKAESYLNSSAFSRTGLIEQLEFEGFTHEQAVYGAEQNGY